MANRTSDQDFYAFAESVESLGEQMGDASEVRFDVVPTNVARRLMSYNEMNFEDVGGQALVVDGLTGIEEDSWYQISLEGKIPGELFNLLTDEPPQPVTLDPPVPVDEEIAADLAEKFSIKALTQRGVISWRNRFRDLPPAEELLVYDVGQGNAAALQSEAEEPVAFVDLGAGCARNAKTYRRSSPPMKLGNSAPVILTHWDMDHYAMALKEPAARRRAWLVPEQKVGPSAMHIASQVDSLYVWYSSSSRRSPLVLASGQLAVHRPSVKGSRNNSGLLISVRFDCGEVLVTGDMSYKVVETSVLGRGANALIAAHHGSARGIGIPPPSADGLVIYSYGLANSYGHPSNASLISHFEEGWERRLDTTMGDILISGCCPYGCRRCRCHRLDGTVLNTVVKGTQLRLPRPRVSRTQTR